MMRRYQEDAVVDRSKTGSELEMSKRPGSISPASCDSGKIRRLIWRLPFGSPIRQIATRLLEQGPAPIDDVAPLLSVLEDGSVLRSRDRTLAAWTLGYAVLTDAQRELAAVRLSRVVEEALSPDVGGRVRRCIKRTWYVVMVLMLSGTLVTAQSMRDWPGVLPSLDILLWMVCMGAFCSLIGTIVLSPIMFPFSLAVDSCASARQAVEALSVMGSPESIGSLAGAYCKALIREAAVSGLTATAYLVTGEHYGLLPSQAVPRLCRALQIADEQTALAILYALEQAGDPRAIPALQRAAKHHPQGTVREAASQMLPTLLERQRTEQSPQVLLRATSAPSAAPDSLLRPTSSPSNTTSEQLLRADVSGHSRPDDIA